jgi:hypothetical protein
MKKLFMLIAAICIASNLAEAHVIPYELQKVKAADVFWQYLLIGFQHILPLGFDHILFIICIFFLNTDFKKIVLQASMFTLAHSITLCAVACGLFTPAVEIIEPLIAFSIVCLALENIATQQIKPWRLAIVFAFGLIHGMGFATALAEMHLQQQQFATALISFNIGVEIGQLAIIILMYLFVAKLFAKYNWYRKIIVVPASIFIAIVACYWTIERIIGTA